MSDLLRQFADLRPPGGASLIMADPPWNLDTWSDKGKTNRHPTAHYETQDLDWIKNLPVAALAASNCVLWLWTVNPMLPHALEVVTAWGFRYTTHGVWIKTTPKGNLHFGTGYWLRSSHETFIIASRGKPRVGSRSVRSVFMSQRREHSRKPDEAYDMARKLAPDGPAIELFSRENRDGWIVFGNETGTFTGGSP